MVFLSPGVKTREIDYSTYVGEISSCIVGMVGAATKGPVGVPTLVTSPSEFTDTFGEPTSLDYGAYCALEFLKQGNQLFYVRVGETTLAKANATISGGLITVSAKECGTYGNQFSFELVENGVDEDDGVTKLYNLIVYRNGSQEEIFQVSFDSDRADWIENVNSYWVDVEYNEDQEIQPFIETFAGFMQDDNNDWKRNVLAGSETLDTIEFTTNVPVAAAKLTVQSDSRATGGFTPGTQVGTPVVDGTSYRVTGLDIEFPGDELGETEATIKTFTPDEGTAGTADVTDFVMGSVPADENAVKTAFSAWLLTLGIDTDDQGTALTQADIDTAGITVTITPANGVDAYTTEILLENVYFDNDKSGTKVLGTLSFKYAFDVTRASEFAVAFTVKLVSEIGIESTENIIVSCVTSAADVTEGENTDGPSTVGAPVPAIITPTSAPVELIGGDDGAPVSIQKVYAGVALFENTEDYDINLIAAPGRFETEIVNKLLEVAQNRADSLAIIDPPQGLSYRDAIDYHNGKLSGDHYPTAKLNTSYGAFFYPWVQVFDQFSGENIWLPPSGVVLAAFAYNDRVGQPWFAAAGLNRGMLNSVVALEVTLDESKRDALYGNGNSVNALVNYKQQGFTIWGNKTLQRKTSALDRINVRRLMNMVRKAIAATSSYLIFEQNNELTWSQWKNQVDPYLENIKRARGIDDYRTKMDAETVTPYYRDRNQMPGKVWINPTRTAEFVQIDFILTNSGAQFTD